MQDKPAAAARHRLGYALKRAQQALRTAMDEALRADGLTTPQYSALSALKLEPGISNAALARSVFVTAQTMLGIVVNLERAGLVSRSEDPTHGRVLKAKLTRKGEAKLRDAHQRVATVLEVMFAAIEPDEAQRLADLLVECAEEVDTGKADRLFRTPERAAGRVRRDR